MPSNQSNPIRGKLSSSSTNGLSLVEKKNSDLFCLCQLDLKIPRPRNGESTLSPSLSVGLIFLFFETAYLSTSNTVNTSLAFILYRQHCSQSVSHLTTPEVSKVAGKQWKSLSEEEKDKWKALAEVFSHRLHTDCTKLTLSRKKNLAIGSNTPTTDISPAEVKTRYLAQQSAVIHRVQPSATDVVARS
jgi:hypothetical protein